eukprot:Clim_evm3s35 gene=Clim_evmTU3s35
MVPAFWVLAAAFSGTALAQTDLACSLPTGVDLTNGATLFCTRQSANLGCSSLTTGGDNEIIAAYNAVLTPDVPYDSLITLFGVNGGDAGEDGKYEPPEDVQTVFGWDPLYKDQGTPEQELNGYTVKNTQEPLPSFVLCKASNGYTLYFNPANGEDVICPDNKGISNMIICYPPQAPNTCQDFYDSTGCGAGTMPNGNNSTECDTDAACQNDCCEDIPNTCQDFYDNTGCGAGTMPNGNNSTECDTDAACQNDCCEDIPNTCQDFYDNTGCGAGTMPNGNNSTECDTDAACQNDCCEDIPNTCQDFYDNTGCGAGTMPNGNNSTECDTDAACQNDCYIPPTCADYYESPGCLPGSDPIGDEELVCGEFCQELCCEAMGSGGVVPDDDDASQGDGSSQTTGSGDDGTSQLSSSATTIISATVAAVVGIATIAVIAGYAYKKRGQAARHEDSISIPEAA